MNTLNRFLLAQQDVYEKALLEIKQGYKQSHWMWYIFPQVRGLGHSETSKAYAIRDLEEAKEYMQHPVLRMRLVEISNALLRLEGRTANSVFGSPDDKKLRSCMTLFAAVENTDPVFKAVLEKYFDGEQDPRTLAIIK